VQIDKERETVRDTDEKNYEKMCGKLAQARNFWGTMCHYDDEIYFLRDLSNILHICKEIENGKFGAKDS
jgi:hypothetical protein